MRPVILEEIYEKINWNRKRELLKKTNEYDFTRFKDRAKR